MKLLLWIVVLLALAVIALGLWVRLAPSDPARWHVDIAAPDYVPPGNAAAFCAGPGAPVSLPAETLADLDRVALAWPRTTRLAGSVEEGRVTWITRTALWGFPDYTTAALREVEGAQVVCLVGRQRFGLEDLGVNATRLGAWVQEVAGLPEPPGLTWNP